MLPDFPVRIRGRWRIVLQPIHFPMLSKSVCLKAAQTLWLAFPLRKIVVACRAQTAHGHLAALLNEGHNLFDDWVVVAFGF